MNRPTKYSGHSVVIGEVYLARTTDIYIEQVEDWIQFVRDHYPNAAESADEFIEAGNYE